MTKQPSRKTEISFFGGRLFDLCRRHGQWQRQRGMRYEDENLWLTQKMTATLYEVSVPAISQYLKRIYADNELESEATCCRT